MKTRDSGKTGLITGATSGIGRATALAVAGEGARLILRDVLAQSPQEPAAQRQAQGNRVDSERCDVARRGDVDALVQRGSVGAIDVALSNACILGTPGAVDAYEESELQRILDVNVNVNVNVNVTGTWRTLRAVRSDMIERRRGNIVVTSSAAGVSRRAVP